MNRQKIIAVFVVILMFSLLILQSCANSSNNANNNASSPDNNKESAGENQTAQTETTEYKAAAEPFDWGGKQFKILVNDTKNTTWLDVDFTCEEQNGDPINDAVYNRNLKIEEMFNIKIVPMPVDQGAHVTSIRKAVKAGDNAYDIAFNTPFDNAALSQEGALYDLFTVPNLDLSQPWWDQNSIKDLSIGNRLYMVTGDIGTMYKKSVGILLFNKQMMQDYALGNPYQLVKDKKWTMDAFLSMCKAVSQDLNGDGKYDDQDRFGILGYSDMIAISLIGGGVKFATKNADDIPEITFYDNKTVDIFNKITEILYDKSLFWSWSAVGSNNERSQAMFANQQGLFNWNEFHAVPTLRFMDTDFGILPMPLYNEQQDRYYHVVNPHVAMMFTIPASNPDLEKTAAVVQNMAAVSKNILTPAYYDISLKGKYARDDESITSMDVIFNSLTYDLGYMNNWGGIADFTLAMVNNYKGDLSSEYDKIAGKAQTALDKMVSKYSAMQ